MPKQIFTVEDARIKARRRLPKMVFDYIDGAAGRELLAEENITAFHKIKLQPRSLVNVEDRSLDKTFLNKKWGLPFGVAPMGMCDLAWPGADKMLAVAASEFNIPLALSTMGSSTIEQTRERAGENAWFQFYVSGDKDTAMKLVDRAAAAGYTTLIFTVDVPHVAPRVRDLRNGFKAPLKIGPKQFIDFALHPQWSVGSVLSGVPSLANVDTKSDGKFKRDSGRGAVDWDFLRHLRDYWPHKLIIKGVLSVEDAVKMQQAGADGIYVSNHGGRQLDSAPASITVLPQMRQALGADYPIVADSGFRDGESIIKALALGADYVMLGRPFSYGIAADGQRGLNTVIQLLADQISAAMAQIGVTDMDSIDERVLFWEPLIN